MVQDLNQTINALNELESQIDDVVTDDDIIVAKKIDQVSTKYLKVLDRLERIGMDVSFQRERVKGSQERAKKLIREFG